MNFGEILNRGRNSKNNKITCQQFFLNSDRLKGQKMTFFCPVFETAGGFLDN